MLAISLITITVIYLLLISLLVYGFDKIADFKLKDVPPKTKFSIVIPFRNEAEHLPELLKSITRFNYPKALFEVILVDDDSTDASMAIIEKLTAKTAFQAIEICVIKNEHLSNSPKKDAISAAIKISNYDWIVTTDADCVLPKYWLDTFDEYIQTHKPSCLVAPVTYSGKTSFLNRFQSLDFLSLQGATIGSFGIKKPILCNGANFAYQKSEFIAVGGFKGNDTISSGDDIFLLQKFLEQNAKKVHYLKSKHTIVKTDPAQNFDLLIQQRLRWASKTSNYDGWLVKLVGLVVLLGNLVCIVVIPAVLFQLIPLKIAVALVVIKWCIDFLLLFKTTRFFKQEYLLLSYLLCSLIYPFFNVGIALFSFFTPFHWKGRSFKK